MSRVVTATYRLQLRRDFPLSAVRGLVPYLHRLGVSHVYLSPILAARAGSAHGYDVIDPTRINPELGTEDDLRALAADLHERGMGIILDIVPNHMAASEHNPYWDNVLERGIESRYADWFDIDWAAPRLRNKVVLPVLGDELGAVLERGELTLHIRDSGARIAYFERTFPLDPATLPKEIQLAQLDPEGRPAAEEWAAGAAGRRRLAALLEAQHYTLGFWRKAGEVNYRRFFDINDLVAVRMESDAIFDVTHRLVLQWVRDGVLDGLRVDHVDGLRQPAWYLGKLRAAVDGARHADAPARVPIFVEKILTGDEELPSDWPVEGTTGYDFMNEVEDLFLDPKGFAAIEAGYRALRHNPGLDFRAIAMDGKRRALAGPLWPDVMRAARAAHAWRFSASVRETADAIVEFIVGLPAYRTYVSEPGVLAKADRAMIVTALEHARASERVNQAALQLIEDAFLAPPDASDHARAELVHRVQQTSGPAAAKGIEDTALYVYTPLASRNEVGGEPDRPLERAHTRLHERNAARAVDWPRTLLAVNTHDTKRSADVRARLDTLTALPDDWWRRVSRWRKLNKPRRSTVRGKLTPDTSAEYLYYQTVFGLWPAQRPERRADDLPDREWMARVQPRLTQYMLKAAREAKTRTSWTEADPLYEQALTTFVRETLAPGEEAHFLPDLARLTALTADRGFANSLARVILQYTSPGAPDLYQGDEFWTFTLVDPDNRAPVDFEQRAGTLDQLMAKDAMTTALSSSRLFENRVKLALVARLLQLRREHGDLFQSGEYVALQSLAPQPSAFAFGRRLQDQRCLVIARTSALASTGQNEELAIPADFAGSWRSALDDRAVNLVAAAPRSHVPVNELLHEGRFGDVLFRPSR
jgi:(1->4)-alpha-D-glucan 1-alpha-D-glucosylmutase